jgi:hypothetical protein
MEKEPQAPLHLMHHFTVQHLRFVCKVETAITLDAQPGTAVRGVLYHALISTFSPNESVAGLPLDPVRALLAGRDAENARGQDLPRAFTVEPPAAHSYFRAGETFEFGVSLLGAAIGLMPYLLRAVRQAGTLGVGRGRGQFRLIQIDEFKPLDDSRRVLMEEGQAVPPRLQITHQQIEAEAAMRGGQVVSLDFKSPLRLVRDGQLVRKPLLGVLLRRLLERAQTLVEHESAQAAHVAAPHRWKEEWARIGQLGDALDRENLVDDKTYWVDIDSYSKMRQRSTPIGGLKGETHWQHIPLEVLVWLLWGQSLHVGKNAVKGDGHFRVW